MKTLGIVGGIGPESTIEYYRSVIAAYRQQRPDGSYPSIVINSIDVTKMLGLIGTNQISEVTEYLVDAVRKLAKAGADFGLLAANTPHIVFDEIQRSSPIPLISIVEAACDTAQTLGLKKVGIFGTRFTMQKEFYPDVFSKAGIALVAPELDDQTYIHDKYMNELLNGIILSETRDRLLMIVDRMIDRQGIDGLLLGGTELPLILKAERHNGIPFLDTTRIHVKYAIAGMFS